MTQSRAKAAAIQRQKIIDYIVVSGLITAITAVVMVLVS